MLVPGTVRLPISLQDGDKPVLDGPPSLAGRIIDANGAVIADGLTAARRGTGLPVPYWSFVAKIPFAGIYTLLVDGAAPEGLALQILEPSQVLVPQVGASLPPLQTPTDAEHRGVEPICTREPACPLHSISLSEALGMEKPVAYLVGTPAYCQVGVCGPVLEMMLEARGKLGDTITMVHAEVYTDETLKVTTPAVTEYQLDYEPVLFITDKNGTIVERLDAVWDREEMDAAISKAFLVE